MVVTISQWYKHWHRFVKNIWGQTKILGGKRVIITDKNMGVSQLLGAHAQGAPQSLRLWVQDAQYCRSEQNLDMLTEISSRTLSLQSYYNNFQCGNLMLIMQITF